MHRPVDGFTLFIKQGCLLKHMYQINIMFKVIKKNQKFLKAFFVFFLKLKFEIFIEKNIVEINTHVNLNTFRLNLYQESFSFAIE